MTCLQKQLVCFKWMLEWFRHSFFKIHFTHMTATKDDKYVSTAQSLWGTYVHKRRRRYRSGEKVENVIYFFRMEKSQQPRSEMKTPTLEIFAVINNFVHVCTLSPIWKSWTPTEKSLKATEFPWLSEIFRTTLLYQTQTESFSFQLFIAKSNNSD